MSSLMMCGYCTTGLILEHEILIPLRGAGGGGKRGRERRGEREREREYEALSSCTNQTGQLLIVS